MVPDVHPSNPSKLVQQFMTQEMMKNCSEWKLHDDPFFWVVFQSLHWSIHDAAVGSSLDCLYLHRSPC